MLLQAVDQGQLEGPLQLWRQHMHQTAHAALQESIHLHFKLC